MIKVDLAVDTDIEALRDDLLARVKDADTIEVETLGELRFTQLRSCLAIINALAFARSCTLRYSGEREFRPPPLVAHYSHEPNITHAKTENAQKTER